MLSQIFVSKRSAQYFILGCVVTFLMMSLPRVFVSQMDAGAFVSGRKLAIVFGDSISQHGFNPANDGWIASLSHLWSRRVDLLNRGFSGFNSRWGLSIINEVVTSHRPHLVMIFFGANDAVIDGVGSFVPLNEYEENIKMMVTTIQKTLPKCSIILITPPPVDEAELEKSNISKGKRVTLDRTNDRTMAYANACIALGLKLNVPVLDAWSSLGGSSQSRAVYLSDGLHLNRLGNNKLFEVLVLLLRKNLPQWMPENLPMQKDGWVAQHNKDTGSSPF